jgi:hypothetical protein
MVFGPPGSSRSCLRPGTCERRSPPCRIVKVIYDVAADVYLDLERKLAVALARRRSSC